MDLVFGFFKNACHMLWANGEINVNHKTTPPFNDWNIEKIAKQSFLTMIDCIDFKPCPCSLSLEYLLPYPYYMKTSMS